MLDSEMTDNIDLYFDRKNEDSESWINYPESMTNFSIGIEIVNRGSSGLLSVHTFNYIEGVRRELDEDGLMQDVGTQWTLHFNHNTPVFYLTPNQAQVYNSANNSTLVIKRNNKY